MRNNKVERHFSTAVFTTETVNAVQFLSEHVLDRKLFHQKKCTLENIKKKH